MVNIVSWWYSPTGEKRGSWEGQLEEGFSGREGCNESHWQGPLIRSSTSTNTKAETMTNTNTKTDTNTNSNTNTNREECNKPNWQGYQSICKSIDNFHHTHFYFWMTNIMTSQ